MAQLEDSQVKFRSVVALVSGMVLLTCTIVGAALKISSSFTDLTAQMKELHESIDDVKTNSYTLTRASEQALRTAIENPSLRVPDPRDPNKLIIVYSATH